MNEGSASGSRLPEVPSCVRSFDASCPSVRSECSPSRPRRLRPIRQGAVREGHQGRRRQGGRVSENHPAGRRQLLAEGRRPRHHRSGHAGAAQERLHREGSRRRQGAQVSGEPGPEGRRHLRQGARQLHDERRRHGVRRSRTKGGSTTRSSRTPPTSSRGSSTAATKATRVTAASTTPARGSPTSPTPASASTRCSPPASRRTTRPSRRRSMFISRYAESARQGSERPAVRREDQRGRQGGLRLQPVGEGRSRRDARPAASVRSGR